MKKYSRIFLTFAFFFVALASVVQADDFKTISTTDLAKGIQDKSLTVMDCNTDEVYKKGHIPGAIFMTGDEAGAKALPQDKNASLVFYCKNPRCMASHKCADVAKSKGYKNLQVYSEGIDGWVKAGKVVETSK